MIQSQTATDASSTLVPWRAEIGAVRILAGPGRLADVAELAAGFGVERILLVTDHGIESVGHAQRASTALSEFFEVWVFDGVDENPTSANVESGTAFAREHEIELIIALGGGSPMDCAKGINFLLTNGGAIKDYLGYGKARQPLLPSIAIPATAGTGSESQSYALITQADTRRKMACGDPKARFRAVILDPEVAVTAPESVARRAGLDALSHAVESLVTTRRNPISSLLAGESWKLLAANFPEAVADPRDPTSPEVLATVANMQLGAHLAGAAIENSMLGAAHAAANPLTARYQIVHGEAVALMLPHVVRFNAAAVDELYRRLEPGGGAELASQIEDFRRRAGLAEQLRDLGVERGALPALARAATDEWTGRFNPRDMNKENYLRLYEEAF